MSAMRLTTSAALGANLALSVSKRIPPLIATRPSSWSAFSISSGEAVAMSNFDILPRRPVVLLLLVHPNRARAIATRAIAEQRLAGLRGLFFIVLASIEPRN